MAVPERIFESTSFLLLEAMRRRDEQRRVEEKPPHAAMPDRSLQAREIGCSRSLTTPCRFVVGTERRLERLFDPPRGSADADLQLALNIHPATPEPGDE